MRIFDSHVVDDLAQEKNRFTRDVEHGAGDIMILRTFSDQSKEIDNGQLRAHQRNSKERSLATCIVRNDQH